MPEGLIKGHDGKFDIIAHLQTLDYLKKNFRESTNKFFVKHENLDAHWKKSLKEMGMNVGKLGYTVGKFICANVDE